MSAASHESTTVYHTPNRIDVDISDPLTADTSSHTDEMHANLINSQQLTTASRGLSTHLDSPFSDEAEDLLFELGDKRDSNTQSYHNERYRGIAEPEPSNANRSWHWNHHIHESTLEFTTLLCVLLVTVIAFSVTLVACFVNAIFVTKSRRLAITMGVMLAIDALAACSAGIIVRRGTKRFLRQCYGWCFRRPPERNNARSKRRTR